MATARANAEQLTADHVIAAGTLRAACNGDAIAFAQLMNAYYPRCLRFARHFLANHEDAEECVQDAFVRVHKSLARYEERQRFNAWLFRILANRCKTARNRARILRSPAMQLDDVEYPTPAQDGFIARDELSRVLGELPSDQREAFLLRHVEGLEYEHIAAITRVSIVAVRMRVSRACVTLRKAVTEADS